MEEDVGTRVPVVRFSVYHSGSNVSDTPESVVPLRLPVPRVVPPPRWVVPTLLRTWVVGGRGLAGPSFPTSTPEWTTRDTGPATVPSEPPVKTRRTSLEPRDESELVARGGRSPLFLPTVDGSL